MSSLKLTFLLYAVLNAAVSLCFIPLGKHLSKDLSLLASWTILLLCLKIPVIIFSYYYEKISFLFGIKKTIILSITGASLTWFIFIFNYYQSNTIINISTYSLFCIFFSAFEYLMPAYIYKLKEIEHHQKASLSNWHITITVSKLVAICLGGFLLDYIGLNQIFVFKFILLLISIPAFYAVFIDLPYELKSKSGKLKLKLRDISLFIRKSFFGIMNPIIPYFILTKMKHGNKELGIFYLCIGLVAMVGAIIYKRVKLTRRQVDFLILSECLGFTFVIISMNTYLFFLAMLLCSFMFPIIDLYEQVNFIKRNEESAERASIWFRNFMILGLISGYLLSNLLVT